ncbi:MAG: CooT family nickel-binding protein [Deltaproteobacteria bacterium]|nr:MAG: CooT family nickel-binding protein [Deltaproteobacteria bacterium]
MCEANVYLDKDGEEELLLEAVYLIEPEGEKLRLENIFSEQKILKATFKLLALSEDKIVLKEVERG